MSARSGLVGKTNLLTLCHAISANFYMIRENSKKIYTFPDFPWWCNRQTLLLSTLGGEIGMKREDRICGKKLKPLVRKEVSVHFARLGGTLLFLVYRQPLPIIPTLPIPVERGYLRYPCLTGTPCSTALP